MADAAIERWVAAAPLFAALGDETRLRLFGRLVKDGPLSIAALAAESDVSRQAVTKHLEVLSNAGLVSGARVGRETSWTVDGKGLSRSTALLEAISHQWDSRLERLRALVEDR